MARLLLTFIFTVAVVFFSLTLAHARIPAYFPGNEVISGELPNSLIRLPSDSESQSNEPARETHESEPLTVASVPLSLVRFRPVDHRFALRSKFPFRCRHHHHHHRLFMPMRQHEEIPFGDDMILASGENGDFDPGMFRGGVRRNPEKWVKFQNHHHHHHHDDDEDDDNGIRKFMFKHIDTFGKEKFKKHFQHHHHKDEEERLKEHKERKDGGGFMKRIRKILDQF